MLIFWLDSKLLSLHNNQQMYKNKHILLLLLSFLVLLTHTLDTFSVSLTHTCSCSLTLPFNSVSGRLMSLHLPTDTTLVSECVWRAVKRWLKISRHDCEMFGVTTEALRAKVKDGMSLITVRASSELRAGEARRNGDVNEGVNKGLNLDPKLWQGYYRSLQALAGWHQLQTGVQNKWYRLLLMIKNVFLQTTWPRRPLSLSACVISPKRLSAFLSFEIPLHYKSCNYGIYTCWLTHLVHLGYLSVCFSCPVDVKEVGRCSTQ